LPLSGLGTFHCWHRNWTFRRQEKNLSIYEAICDHLCPIEGFEEVEMDEHCTMMEIDGEWGSDLELATIATMLGTNGWVFLIDRWLCYRPRFVISENGEPQLMTMGMKDKPFDKMGAICLINESAHYSPVISVMDTILREKRTRERRLIAEQNDENGQMVHSYRLIGVVSHIGSTSESGHYVSDVFTKGQWLHCDDSTVRKTDEETVRKVCCRSAYVFIYMAKEISDQIHMARSSSMVKE